MDPKEQQDKFANGSQQPPQQNPTEEGQPQPAPEVITPKDDNSTTQAPSPGSSPAPTPGQASPPQPSASDATPPTTDPPVQPSPTPPAVPAPPVPEPQPAPPQQETASTPQPTTQPSQPEPMDTTPPQAAPAPGASPSPAQSPQPAPVAPPKSPGTKKKKLLLLAIPALIIVTAIGIFLALSVFGSGIKLTTYSDDRFSIQYPEEYEIEKEEGMVAFVEKLPEGASENDEEIEETRSRVQVIYIDIPASLSSEQRGLLESQLRRFTDQVKQEAANDPDAELKNDEVTEIEDFVGVEAQKLTAEIHKDGEKLSDMYVVSALTDDAFYIVAVSAHVADEGLSDLSAKIVNSFKLEDD